MSQGIKINISFSYPSFLSFPILIISTAYLKNNSRRKSDGMSATSKSISFREMKKLFYHLLFRKGKLAENLREGKAPKINFVEANTRPQF